MNAETQALQIDAAAKKTAKALTREQWLQHATSYVRRAVAKRGVVVPEVKVSCSWPGGGDSKKRIGECWARAASKAHINEVFISPRIEESSKVMSILTHELAHAVLDCKHGHGREFEMTGMLMFLDGKTTTMGLPDALATE